MICKWLSKRNIIGGKTTSGGKKKKNSRRKLKQKLKRKLRANHQLSGWARIRIRAAVNLDTSEMSAGVNLAILPKFAGTRRGV